MSTIKNFGIAGVSSDLQLGKKGGRFLYDSANGIFSLTESDGTTATRVQIADGVNSDEATSVSQVDTKIQNLDPSNVDALGTMSEQDANAVAITGGSIDGTTIGGSTAAAGTFTTATASSLVATTDVTTDSIVENTADAGVTIDGVLLKDTNVTADQVTANTGVVTDTISEATTDNGVDIETVNFTDGNIDAPGNVTVQGDLTVNGTTTTLNTQDLQVEDNTIVANYGETGDGVTAGTGGLEVDRGTLNNARAVWVEANDVWRFELDDGSLADLEANLVSVVGTQYGGFGTDISGYGAESLVKADGSELAIGSADQVLTSDGTTVSYSYVDTLNRTSDGLKVIDTANASSVDGEYLDMASSSGSLTLSAFNDAGTGDVDLILSGQDNGEVLIGNPSGSSVISAQDNQTLTVSGGDSDDTAGAGNLELFGGNGTNDDPSGDVILQGGTGGSAEGITIIRDSAGDEIASFENGATGATDYFTVSNGTGSVDLAASGDSTDVDLVLTPKGAGVILAPVGYDISSAADEALANKGYVDSQVSDVSSNVDSLARRASFTADSTATSFVIGTLNNVAGKTYYVSNVVLHVTTDFSGNGVDYMTVTDGTNTLVAEADADILSGSYYIELPFANSTAGGSDFTVEFYDSGDLAVAPTAGAVTATVEYKVL